MSSKPLFLVFVALLLAASLSSSIVKPAVAAGYTDVTVSEAKAMIDTNQFLMVVDVRNESEYDAGHIRNAKLIPLWELAARLNELNKTDEILVYCRAGGRSANASQVLSSDGFSHVYNMLGGITEWTREGYTVYIKYPSIQEAINNATAGDTIHVSAGLYDEQLSVDKPVVLEGENRYTTVINGTATMLHVRADNVSITDFTVQYVGCACFGYCAVNVTDNQNINVTDNIITSDDFGIRVVNARKVVIANNSITHTGNACMVVLNSSEVSVLENNITASDGIEVDTCTESIFSGNTIFSSMGAGIFAYGSYENTFCGNNVSVGSSAAVSVSDSHDNAFFDNNVSSSSLNGLFFWQSDNNSIFHNNFLFNGGQISNYDSTNLWDNGFEGNFWRYYTGVDADSDGIGDTPNILDSTNRDNYPLMGMLYSFKTSLGNAVDIVSNSTVDEFKYVGSNRTIEFRVSNRTANQTMGFCRVSIPHRLIDPSDGSISVVIDNGSTPVLFLNDTLYDNGTRRWIYFTYPHSTHKILIVPEFPIFLVPPLYMVTVVIGVATCKKRRSFLRTSCQRQTRRQKRPACEQCCSL